MKNQQHCIHFVMTIYLAISLQLGKKVYLTKVLFLAQMKIQFVSTCLNTEQFHALYYNLAQILFKLQFTATYLRYFTHSYHGQFCITIQLYKFDHTFFSARLTKPGKNTDKQQSIFIDHDVLTSQYIVHAIIKNGQCISNINPIQCNNDLLVNMFVKKQHEFQFSCMKYEQTIS